MIELSQNWLIVARSMESSIDTAGTLPMSTILKITVETLVLYFLWLKQVAQVGLPDGKTKISGLTFKMSGFWDYCRDK